MIDLKKYRIIDISQHLVPGILKIDGSYTHGSGTRLFGKHSCRRLELREFTYVGGNDSMHFIETETHIGSHVEAPSHVRSKVDGGKHRKSISDFPVEKWIGEAIILDFNKKLPVNGKRQPILIDDLNEVKEDDIVIMWSNLKPDEQPYISKEAAEFLVRKKIKQLAWEGVDIGPITNHNLFLYNEICLIEGLVNLDKIRRKRVFYIGLGLNWYGLDASPIRALVLEEK